MTRASEADELAAPLDALLIEGALGGARRFTPDASTAKFLGKLLTRPAKTGQRLGSLAAELVRVGAGTSDLAPDPLGGAPVWVVPNPSGLNKEASLADRANAYGQVAIAVGIELFTESA
jgi:hypothetical protein